MTSSAKAILSLGFGISGLLYSVNYDFFLKRLCKKPGKAPRTSHFEAVDGVFVELKRLKRISVISERCKSSFLPLANLTFKSSPRVPRPRRNMPRGGNWDHVARHLNEMKEAPRVEVDRLPQRK